MISSNTLGPVRIAIKDTIGPSKTPTGINKQPVEGPLFLGEFGLEGDFQVDSRVHGGLDKAVYHFPLENYQVLKEVFPHLADRLDEPCVGENFSTIGMTESNVFIGDIYSVGEAEIQVSQPRMPCWKLNQRIGNAHVLEFVIMQKCTGWYYRVVKEGHVQQGDEIKLKTRLQDEYSIEKIWEHWIAQRQQGVQVAKPLQIEGLSPQWRFDW
ncbi:MOSC domain-containing protein [Parasalinivibrio latis]|uniref:MOSC domain-containing protein n=1 Tax=Parasalinivibrio latis TaxID=2952610 RepID=UPI0030E08749